jgi:hypothetical protein
MMMRAGDTSKRYAGPVWARCGNVGPTMARGRKHYHQCYALSPVSRTITSVTHYHQCKACYAKFTTAFGTPLEGTHLPMRA